MITTGRILAGLAIIWCLALVRCVVDGSGADALPASLTRVDDFNAAGDVGMCAGGDQTCANEDVRWQFRENAGGGEAAGTVDHYVINQTWTGADGSFTSTYNNFCTSIASTVGHQCNQTLTGGSFAIPAGHNATAWDGEFGTDITNSGPGNMNAVALLIHASVANTGGGTGSSLAIESTTGNWAQLDPLSGINNLGTTALGGAVTTYAGATVDFSGGGAFSPGFNVQNFEVPGSSTVNPDVGIGTAQSDGTQLQLKNTRAANGAGGMDLGLDTTVNAAVGGGMWITRGAGGDFGSTNNKGLWVGPANGLASGEEANSFVLYNREAGKSVYIFAGGFGAAHQSMRFLDNNATASGYLQIGGTSGPRWITGTGAPVIACANGDLFSRTDGGAATTLYVCTAANTWTAK
jgi:hypothetical protein